MKKYVYILPLLMMSLILPCMAEAANHYVRAGASGTGSGADWTNAYTNLPSTLVRGDTYYLAGGSYGSHTFADAVSGTTLITIKKATTTDYGTATGWQSSYASAQAVFGHWQFSTNYYLIDGQVRNSNWQSGALDQYGIKVSGQQPLRLDDGNSHGANYVTFRNIDFAAGGRCTGAGDDVVYGMYGSKYITFTKCALHDSDRTIFLMRGEWQYLVVEYCYVGRNTSTTAVHGEILSDIGSDYVTFRNNIIVDPDGTAVFAILNGGGSQSSGNTANGWAIYGNVIYHSSGFTSNCCTSKGDSCGITGLVFSANDASNQNWSTNWSVLNNTIANIKGLYSGVVIQAGSGNTAYNNIWYNSVNTSHTNTTLDYNWYYNTTSGSDTGTHKQTCTTNCGIFVNSASDFHLNGTNLPSAGMTLASPYNSDMEGLTRGSDNIFDRGAYEYQASTSSTAPKAPTGFTIDSAAK